jgi:CRP-like cAMP-binding protein
VTFIDYLEKNAGVTDDQLTILKNKIKYKRIEKKEIVLSKGQICKHAFFVEAGLLRFYSIDQEGHEHIVQFAPENCFICDRGSIFFNEPSIYYIDAIEVSTVVAIDQQFVSLALEISPQFAKYNELILQNHVRNLQNRVNLLIGASAEERYLDFINAYPDLTLRVPQWMIASYLGITPESLSRVRKALASRNFKP